jgi:hypothetical protein
VGLLRSHPGVRWKVVVNDTTHPWRPPCKCINVGLRHAAGRHVFIASPESALVGDVLAHALDIVSDLPGGIALGQVRFSQFAHIRGRSDLERQFDGAAAELHLEALYGSICGPRSAFEAVRGYDESFAAWGGDDDNVRVRLEMAGCTLLACPQIRLVHCSFEERDGAAHPTGRYDAAAAFSKLAPGTAAANPDADWGRDFQRVAYASDPPAADLDRSWTPPPLSSLPGSMIPTGSRRRCRRCGCTVHYEPHAPQCPAGRSDSPDAWMGAADGDGAKGGTPLRIGCVIQARDEERYLPGCLAHLRDHADGFVVLDDGSTDGTAAILDREPKLLDRLVTLPGAGHVWRERENKRRLLQRALGLGLDWVLCCDADERYETAFLERLRVIAAAAAAGGIACLAVGLKELWDGPRQYRVDGIWGSKTRARFFRLPKTIAFEQDQDLHGQWYPDEIRALGRIALLDYHLYHLKTISREDRIRRRDFYRRLDPEKRFQPLGYDYLAEEGEGLRLEEIPAGREYDLASLPADMAC